MNPETLNALKAAIRHWEFNLHEAQKGYAFDTHSDECALCTRFIILCKKEGEFCPVYKKTGKAQCVDTPYYQVTELLGEEDQDALVRAIKDEIDFLKSLLPKEELK